MVVDGGITVGDPTHEGMTTLPASGANPETIVGAKPEVVMGGNPGTISDAVVYDGETIVMDGNGVTKVTDDPNGCCVREPP